MLAKQLIEAKEQKGGFFSMLLGILGASLLENLLSWICGVEYIPKEIEKIIGNKNIIPNIYRIQTNDSVMFRNFFVLDLLIPC